MAEAGFTLLLAPTLTFFALLHLGQQVESPHQSPHSPPSLTFGPHTHLHGCPILLSILKVYFFFLYVNSDPLIIAVLYKYFSLRLSKEIGYMLRLEIFK